MRPDKAAVVDEVWDEARILAYLDKQPMGQRAGTDFSALLHAYRSMRAPDFERFIRAFVAAGRDVNAPGPDGATLLATIARHERAGEFRSILVAAGAT